MNRYPRRFPGAILRPCLFLLLAASSGAQTGAKLAIDAFSFRQYEGGPEVAAGFRAQPGSLLHVEFRVSGFGKSDDDDPKVRLDYSVLVTDSAGLLLADPKAGKVEVELADEDREWRPKIAASFALPLYLRPGEYRVTVGLRDRIANSEARGAFPFSVSGEEVPSSNTLTAYKFEWFRSELEADPLRVAAYRPGEPVWGRFLMTGFKVNEDRRVNIEYGLTLSGESGKILFQQELCAREDKKFPYPPAYLPGVVNLQPDSKVAPGTYTITLILRDLIAGTTSESRHSFRIER
ncbi:MAG: hypothetical protein SFV18_07240 [Bryobacteraceae bacterium]|nr:hypothetical protein [Bryobacteraceae bacterium]